VCEIPKQSVMVGLVYTCFMGLGVSLEKKNPIMNQIVPATKVYFPLLWDIFDFVTCHETGKLWHL